MIPLLGEGRAALEKHQPRDGPGPRRLGPRLLHEPVREGHPAQSRPTSNASTFRQSNSEHSRHWFFRGRLIVDGKEVSGQPDEDREGHLGGATGTTASSPSATTRAPSAATTSPTIVPAVDRRTCAVPADAAHIPHHLHGRDAQLPLRRCALPGRRDRHRRPHPRRAGDGHGGPGRCRHRGLLRGQPAHPRLRASLGGRGVCYPHNLASPLQIEVEASNGASDYGNKFGEPLIQGFTRSFGLRMPDGERREWIKPIMFSGGVGQMDSRHTEKTEAQTRHAGGQGRRTGLPHRHGRRRSLVHDPGREHRRAGLQRRAARRRRDGAEAEPRDPRLRGAGRAQPHQEHP